MTSEIELLKQELAELKQEYQDFSYIVSHDLAGPLRHIDGFSKLIARKQDDLDEKSKSHLQYILDSIGDMQMLMESLLKFSRAAVDLGNYGAVDLNIIAQEVLSIIIEEYKLSGGNLKIDTLPTIKGEVKQLYKVFYEIIDNAAKFKSPDKELELYISCNKEGQFYSFQISDNGIGVIDKYLDEVLLPLKRAGRGAEYKGAGIGLAVAKKIIHQHGGKLLLPVGSDSSLHSGTSASFSISFTLPA